MSSLDPAGSAAADRPWTLWSVLRRPARDAYPADGPGLVELAEEPTPGVTLRGFYDVSGLRADADVMVWLHGESAEALQSAQRRLRRSRELSGLSPTWAAMGVHRPAEFSASHEPAYMRETEPKDWLTVYPFVRSYEWYLLPQDERRAMLGEHGREGRTFPQVLSNTVASFALGDYEWLLALEADELTDLVDLMRHLRATEARRHVREEIPFFTGRRITAQDVAEVVR
ncbi:hydrogen peroxide-dependent heme synthase [Actinotalea sp.]|uniref:hydrogen peroxide-dependent heme synthase n=1 Tax=Actinotalea sp. TaxID=1872145 RepID=UPI003562C090